MASSLDRTSDFTYDGSYAGFGAVDFWEWFSSYSLDAVTRGGIAEYIVMKALGQIQERNIWEPFDLVFNGFRIEIKSASLFTCKSKIDDQYVYTPNSRVSFEIAPHHRHISGNDWSVQKRHSDFYIFCLLKDTNACVLENWDFYIAKTSDLDLKYGNQKSVSLSVLKRSSFPLCDYSTLKYTFEYMINGGAFMESNKPVIELFQKGNENQDAFMLELQRLVLCYQEASRDDRNVVWAALNKYANKIDKLK